ncbi:unnamed protein product [Ambrosiozyma monospora]|uniref:Unnamed protein product n=1 Tax=Ambrosiozyma monospora TaxID=43982 RepID=A0ACB5UA37_AMBMO|nr:unnamed protein product [Ambrosiozyma monospora]
MGLFTQSSDGITFENLPRDYEELQVPVYLLKGHSGAFKKGLILVESDKYSPQCFEVHEGYFKLLLNLDHGKNNFTIKHVDGGIGNNGIEIWFH